MAKNKKKYYAVLAGRRPGIYLTWFGSGGAAEQVYSFPGAIYKGFETLDEAQAFLDSSRRSGTQGSRTSKLQARTRAKEAGPGSHAEPTQIYTDGGCINNPGPGGYGVVMIQGDTRKELSGGFRFTTNNRMELMACIVGLKALGPGYADPVRVFTDSRYVVNGIEKGWAKKWRQNNWMRDKSHSAENIDLWSELLDLTETYDVRFEWVKGHAGNRENERCDELAKLSAVRPDLAPDDAYEKGQTRNTLSLF
ncbi:MAG TPA: ribonuclease HI [Deltaproteobacteria bacterium]|nr:ribonuclease HI [Deltaproteobacteria bacterium]